MRIDIYHHNADDRKSGESEDKTNIYLKAILEAQSDQRRLMVGFLETLEQAAASGTYNYKNLLSQIHNLGEALNANDMQIMEGVNKTKDLIIINNQKQEQIMKTLDDVLADVQSESTLIDGLGTLISGLRQQLADALSGVLTTDQQAKVDAIFDAAEANKAKLAAAAATGTAAQGQPGTGTDNGGTVENPTPATSTGVDESKLPG